MLEELLVSVCVFRLLVSSKLNLYDLYDPALGLVCY